MSRIAILLILILPLAVPAAAEPIDEDQWGAWYMYFFNTRLGDGPWGLQGDVQYRDWELIGDLEQLLFRGGLTYTPEHAKVLLTLGFASITNGEFGDGDDTSTENRAYQEALLPQPLAPRIHLRHRFRYEQRWVEGQDFRTRFRYGLFADLLLNRDTMDAGVFYVALYNELFINGERDIGEGRGVEYFDRNRFYAGIGYGLTDRLRVQVGVMNQTTDDLSKNQLQFGLHHGF